MIEKEVQELLSFIDGNPTAYHTTASVRNILLKEGFSELLESRRWQLEPGRSYFVCRNGSSILAFRMGEQLENYSFNVAAAHTDSPCFRIKENAEIHMGRKYTKLNTEGYGGMICSTWMDRPLSVAGRVLIKENDAITSRLLTLDRDLLMIPSVAIHMNREVNDKASYNKQVDMLPLLGGAAEEGVLKKLIAAELQVAEEQILGSDLFLCIREKAAVWGCNEEFISSGRLDDQQCVFGILKGFLKAHSAQSINVAAFFDNEEVGSGTCRAPGACSARAVSGIGSMARPGGGLRRKPGKLSFWQARKPTVIIDGILRKWGIRRARRGRGDELRHSGWSGRRARTGGVRSAPHPPGPSRSRRRGAGPGRDRPPPERAGDCGW